MAVAAEQVLVPESAQLKEAAKSNSNNSNNNHKEEEEQLQVEAMGVTPLVVSLAQRVVQQAHK